MVCVIRLMTKTSWELRAACMKKIQTKKGIIVTYYYYILPNLGNVLWNLVNFNPSQIPFCLLHDTTRGFFETGLCHNQQQQPALSFYLVVMFRESSLQLFFCLHQQSQPKVPRPASALFQWPTRTRELAFEGLPYDLFGLGEGLESF